jgi:aspartate kinase
MIVMKFGGTSVGTPERIMNVYDIVELNIKKEPIVVVSAVGGVTDLLLSAGNDALAGKVDIAEIEKKHDTIIKSFGFSLDLISDLTAELKQLLQGISMLKEISPKTMAYLVSFGERISCKLVSQYLNDKGIKSKPLFAYDIGMVTDDKYDEAGPLAEAYEKIKNALEGVDYIPVITGFIGKNSQGDITTLGRGGSDFSAAIIGAAVNAEEIQIWTDVDGIMTTDPRIVAEAKNIPVVSFNEASELSYFGAKVLHPKTIVPAMNKDIPVVVKNTANPAHPGTRIVKCADSAENSLKAISVKKKISLINIYSLRMFDSYGFLAKIFEIFNKHKIIIDMVSTSEVNVSVTVDSKADVSGVIKELEEFSTVKLELGKAIICVVGEGLKRNKKIVGSVFDSLSQVGIIVEMISQGASEINLSFVVDETRADSAVKALHSSLF